MDMQPVKWGIVSTADINRKVIPGAKASSKVDLIGVASRTQERAEQYASSWEIPRAYGSYEALLADPDIEAVYISLPNTLHCEWSIKALEAGKHVLCEKPLSRHPEEVAAAFDTAERSGRHLMEAFMWRHNPQSMRLKELVEQGAIGELRLVRSVFSYGLYDETNIRLMTDLEGGSLMDVGCYNVSGSRFLGGEPERVWGEAWFGPTGTDWVFTGTMRFPGDVIALFDCGTALANRDELEVVGSEGSLFVDDPWHCLEPGIDLRLENGVERIEVE
jgi:D-xylose 1-dehydrogenase (NADP+, D-xylono-1,5-lactone-forming)